MSENAPHDLAYASDVVCAFFTDRQDGSVDVCGRVSGHPGRHYDQNSNRWFGPAADNTCHTND
jgi:hypothetical protein